MQTRRFRIFLLVAIGICLCNALVARSLVAPTPDRSQIGVYLNPDSGRFWSRDVFEGIPTDPLSLHKYLYGEADAVNLLDPSGFLSLAEIKTVEGIGAELRKDLDRGKGPLARRSIKRLTCKVFAKSLEVAVKSWGKNHHPIPQFLGGAAKQELLVLDPQIHRLFHVVLNLILKDAGAPLGGLGGPGNSSKAWLKVLQKGEFGQKVAFGALIAAAEIVDERCKTQIRPAVIEALKNDQFKNFDF
jgi:hypothetical protein